MGAGPEGSSLTWVSLEDPRMLEERSWSWSQSAAPAHHPVVGWLVVGGRPVPAGLQCELGLFPSVDLG